MTRKKREREFTPEEAYALTMRDAIPHWYGASPLVVGVNLPDRSYPQPLDPIMNSGTWVFFFTSATGAEFQTVREIFSLWIKRYRPLGVGFIFSFLGRYDFFSERRVMETWVASLGFPTPVVCDVGGKLAKSFGATGEPAIALLSEGKILLVDSGPDWTKNAEIRLQSLLRENAPGLSLWPVLQNDSSLLRTTQIWPLHAGAKAITTNQVVFVGNWQIDENRIVTSDPKAEIHLTAPGSAVLVVARSLSDFGDPTRISFDTDGASFSDTFAGKDFAVDTEGNSGLVLSAPRAYFALRGLTPILRKLRFRFPFAKISPVAIYGFEFGD